MITGKSATNKAISLLLAIVFLSTNIAYSDQGKLRIPIQSKTTEGRDRFLASVKRLAEFTYFNPVMASSGTPLRVDVSTLKTIDEWEAIFSSLTEDTILLVDSKIPSFLILRLAKAQKEFKNTHVKGLVVLRKNITVNDMDEIEKLLIPVIEVVNAEEFGRLAQAKTLTLSSDGIAVAEDHEKLASNDAVGKKPMHLDELRKAALRLYSSQWPTIIVDKKGGIGTELKVIEANKDENTIRVLAAGHRISVAINLKDLRFIGPDKETIKELKATGRWTKPSRGAAGEKLASNQGVKLPLWWQETGGLIIAIEKLSKLTSKPGRNVVLTFKAPDFYPYADYYRDQTGAEMIREGRSIVDLSDEGIDAAIELGKAIAANKGGDWGVEFPTNATMKQIEMVLIDAAGLRTAHALPKITEYFERLSEGWKEKTHVVFTFDNTLDGFRFQGIAGVPRHEYASRNGGKTPIEYTIRYRIGSNVDVPILLDDIGKQLVNREIFEPIAWRIHASNIITSIELAELSGKAIEAKALKTGL